VKIKHIKKTKDFAEVLNNSEKIRGKKLTLYLQQGAGAEELRVGIVVSKKVAPLAVKRNYTRRLIYTFFREHGDSWKNGVKVVVRVVKDIRGTKKKALSKEIREELDSLTQKAGIKK